VSNQDFCHAIQCTAFTIYADCVRHCCGAHDIGRCEPGSVVSDTAADRISKSIWCFW
jgi:hypothetical protein